ncbi:MAG: FRG domain-containing protein [Hydrogenophaga sp.]|jgi:hypothetical protein|nr:FRG domain-containing protein [Hydrogenophaga sp.]
METPYYHPQNLTELHDLLRGFRPHSGLGWWYRGHADRSWALIPKAGRHEFNLPSISHIGRFRYWCQQAVAYLPGLPENEWERLALAQHHGLATWLLDWSSNPLVALFFACVEHPGKDGVLYFHVPRMFIEPSVLSIETKDVPGYGFSARSISTRILNQRGCFTVHSPPDLPIICQEHSHLNGTPDLAAAIISAQLKPDVLAMLNDYGINRVTLFPDLDGLSGHINWETTRMLARKVTNERS